MSHFSYAQRHQYQPHTMKSGNVLLGLLYIARSLEISAPNEMTANEIDEVNIIAASTSLLFYMPIE